MKQTSFVGHDDFRSGFVTDDVSALATSKLDIEVSVLSARIVQKRYLDYPPRLSCSELQCSCEVCALRYGKINLI